jgi:regulator of replication initiation timing
MDEFLEVRAEEAMEETEAKYRPLLAEKDRENQALALEIEELRQKLREAGIAVNARAAEPTWDGGPLSSPHVSS